MCFAEACARRGIELRACDVLSSHSNDVLRRTTASPIAIVPAIGSIAIRGVAQYKTFYWEPSQRINIVRSLPGAGASTLCKCIQQATYSGQNGVGPQQTVSLVFLRGEVGESPRFPVGSIDPPVDVFGEALKALKHSPSHLCVLLDKDVVGVLDGAQRAMLTAALERSRCQVLLFATTTLPLASAAHWELVRSIPPVMKPFQHF